MIAKKYISALIILLTLLGFSKKPAPAPNQEIELQFADQATVIENTDDLIQAIKKQLEALGVTSIQVRQQEEGILKISYYSDENVAEIKRILSTNGITSEEIPGSEKAVTFQDGGNLESYKIDVYELQTASNSYAGIHGKYILALQKDYDKAPSPNSFANANSFQAAAHKVTIALAYTESTYTAIPKENISYEIPDVRAGPTFAMHS